MSHDLRTPLTTLLLYTEILRCRKYETPEQADNYLNKIDAKARQYFQLDPETKSVIHRRVTDIQLEQKLKDMEKVNDIELGTQQKQQVRDGKPVELNVGGEKVSVGVDLREPQGFKVIRGDLKEWERQQKLRYDELHPEYLGLVQTDSNRWEYQKVVDRQSQERTMKLHSPKENVSQSLKR